MCNEGIKLNPILMGFIPRPLGCYKCSNPLGYPVACGRVVHLSFMNKFIFKIVLLITFNLNLFAGNGTSGFEFLRTDFSARSGAMAGSFLAMRGEINGLFHNPACMAYTEETQFTFNYTDYLLDINGGFAGYSQRIQDYGQVSAAILYLDYGVFEETTERADKTGRKYGANDIAFAVSYADILEDRFTYGVTVKYAYSKIESYTASAVALDFGLIYEAPFEENLFIGLSLTNVGKSVSAFINTKESLPMSLRLGLTQKLAHLPLVINFSLNDLNVDEDTIIDRLEKFSIGGEFTISEIFRLRFGYDNELHHELLIPEGSKFTGISFGFGFIWNNYRFDYALSSFGELGITNRIGISGTL